MAEAQRTLYVVCLQVRPVRDPELGLGLDEMPGVAPDRQIGHELPVVLEDLRFGVGEGVEIGTHCADARFL